MDLNAQKEMFSYAYVQAVASVAGYSVCFKPRPMDNAGVDLSIEATGEVGKVLFPKIDVQVKCTADENILDKDYVKFSLPVKNYKILIDSKAVDPLILVVVLVPKDLSNWLQITEENILMKKCGYWVSLKGTPPTQNKEKITVELPRQNLFTPVNLQRMMEKIGRKENL
jgi:hypothetical protein